MHGKRILAQPNQARPTDGMTPLCIAAGRGYEESVRTLLENGADRNRRNLKGMCECLRDPLYSCVSVARACLHNVGAGAGAGARNQPYTFTQACHHSTWQWEP